jgi:RNA polymerase sigma-70 factor (ECF subfamily)
VRDLSAASDEELLRMTPRLPRAFDEFFLRYESLVLGYMRRRTPSADIALDLTAETFVQALASVGRFKPGPDPAVAWLLGIARHTLLKSLRRGRVVHRARSRLSVGPIAVDDDDLDRVDRIGTLSASELLAVLPPDQAAAIKARVFDEQPYANVAARLRCSPLVARKRVSRGLATLRSVIDEESI